MLNYQWEICSGNITGWWFGTWILFSPTRLGMMIQSDFHIFQGGWNHQLDKMGCRMGWNILKHEKHEEKLHVSTYIHFYACIYVYIYTHMYIGTYTHIYDINWYNVCDACHWHFIRCSKRVGSGGAVHWQGKAMGIDVRQSHPLVVWWK